MRLPEGLLSSKLFFKKIIKILHGKKKLLTFASLLRNKATFDTFSRGVAQLVRVRVWGA